MHAFHYGWKFNRTRTRVRVLIRLNGVFFSRCRPAIQCSDGAQQVQCSLHYYYKLLVHRVYLLRDYICDGAAIRLVNFTQERITTKSYKEERMCRRDAAWMQLKVRAEFKWVLIFCFGESFVFLKKFPFVWAIFWTIFLVIYAEMVVERSIFFDINVVKIMRKLLKGNSVNDFLKVIVTLWRL